MMIGIRLKNVFPACSAHGLLLILSPAELAAATLLQRYTFMTGASALRMVLDMEAGYYLRMNLELDAACQRAVELHQRGQWLRARQMSEEILRVQPDHFVALHLCGVIATQTGSFPRAVELLSRAIARSPQVASVHCNLAIAQRQLRDFTAALASISRAIALNPTFAVAHLNRAAILIELNQPEPALRDYDRAIAIDGGSADAFFSRGCLLDDLKNADGALRSLHQAIVLNPAHGAAHHRRGNILREQGELLAALASYDLAGSSGVTSAALWLDRGATLSGLRNYVAALESFDRAIAADRGSAAAHYNRGIVLERLGDREAAVGSFSQAIAIEPGFVLAYLNGGVALAELGRADEALERFEQAICLRSDFAEAHFAKALVLLRLGRYREGWREYEWRWQEKSAVAYRERREFTQPLWLGDAPVAGKTILLHAEQGFGDTLQFCRYASLVAERGARVILEAPAPLVALLTSLVGPSQVIARGHALPEFDLHCPLMSLPAAFGTALDSIPATVPYLTADAGRIDNWNHRLGQQDGFRVGLVWAGRALSDDTKDKASFNARRDIPVDALGPLGHLRAQFYSLQTGPAAGEQLAQLRALWGEVPIVDCGSELVDFADTAALIANLDLIITVDTATAHLAGALGKRVWILNRLDTCWRWLLERTDSPWYPTATIYRQTRPGSWQDVLLRVQADLAAMSAGPPPATGAPTVHLAPTA
jgi:tetratricopeptide (TPR) repeat protein